MTQEAPRLGRPPVMRRRKALPFYGDESDMRIIQALAEKWGCSAAAALRRLVREAGRREKVT